MNSPRVKSAKSNKSASSENSGKEMSVKRMKSQNVIPEILNDGKTEKTEKPKKALKHPPTSVMVMESSKLSKSISKETSGEKEPVKRMKSQNVIPETLNDGKTEKGKPKKPSKNPPTSVMVMESSKLSRSVSKETSREKKSVKKMKLQNEKSVIENVGKTEKGKPKKASKHPPTSVMVMESIKNLRNGKGSSAQSIRKYITTNFDIDMNYIRPHLNKFLHKAVSQNILEQVSGTGATGRFKIKKGNRGPELKKRKSKDNSKEGKVKGTIKGVKEKERKIKEKKKT